MPYLVQNRSPWFQSWVHLAASHCNHTPLGSQATTTHCNHTPPPDRQSQPGGMELRRLRRLEEKGVEEEEEGEAGSGCWRSLVFTEVILLETSAEELCSCWTPLQDAN